jgi:HEAT repeat protein
MIPNFDDLSHQLDSPDVKDRKLALAALRDVSAQDAFPLIQKVINDPNQQVRSMAIFMMGLKPTPEAVPILIEILQTASDYGVRADAAGALGYIEDVRAFEPLVEAFETDGDWLVRFSAAVSLGNLKDPRAKPVLLRALQSPEVVIQQAAIAALGEIKAIDAVDAILGFVQSDDWLVRQRLAEALGNLDTEKSASALRYLAKDPHANVAEAATISLQRLARTT